MADAYYTLDIAVHRFAESYQVELSHVDPNSQARIAPARGAPRFDFDELRAKQQDPAGYGQALARQLLCDADVERRFLDVERTAAASGDYLRVALSFDVSAQELDSLRWEHLRHPETGAWLAVSERVLLSRFMSSRDWRAIKLRAKSELRAVIAVSAPHPAKLEKLGLAPVDFDAEVGPVKAALAGVEVRVLGGPGDPLTLERLVEGLRDDADIVYLVSHGMFGRSTNTPALILQDEAGEAKAVKGEEITARLANLQRLPRLVVMASCQSAGDGGQVEGGRRTSVQATLAGRLADVGVPAILAMQGTITMDTVAQLMPPLFAELLRDGQIDRALASARARVQGRHDAWMPALYTRLSTGQLWYTPGFRASEGDTQVWRRLLDPVRNGKVVPILGPRMLDDVHGAAFETARRLADASDYPLEARDRDDLPRVTEYMSVRDSRYNVIRKYQDQLLEDLIAQHRGWLPAKELPPNKKPKLGKLLAMVGDHLREQNEADPYRILAQLRASVYVTTNYVPMLGRALEANERKPALIRTRWRYDSAPLPADAQAIPTPSAQTPLVFHAFGAFAKDADDGLVLTEDDYFDSLIRATAEQLLPPPVESALVDNSLLFLGFRLTDWHFRVLFRLMMSLPGRKRLAQYSHVAVQLDPDMQGMSDVEAAKDFLARYFGKEANIEIYWGSAEEFLAALHRELQAAGELAVDEPEEDEDDEWNF